MTTPVTGPTAAPQLRRIRWAVRGVLFLGVAASVTANILHARHNPISQTIAAWPPLAFLITVELISRVPVHRRSTAVLRLVATAAIAGIAAWVSYWHMAATVGRYGETGAAPFLMPFSVDGLIVVASLSLVELAGRIRTVDQESRAAATVADEQLVEDVPEQSVEPPAPVDVGTQSEAQLKLTPAAEKIARARRRQPSLTQQEAAGKAGVHINTVKTWWAHTVPAEPVAERINGSVPELQGASA